MIQTSFFSSQEEERRLEEEEQKRQENELAFRSWMLKKRQQLRQERRVQRAQEMERMSGKVHIRSIFTTNRCAVESSGTFIDDILLCGVCD